MTPSQYWELSQHCQHRPERYRHGIVRRGPHISEQPPPSETKQTNPPGQPRHPPVSEHPRPIIPTPAPRLPPPASPSPPPSPPTNCDPPHRRGGKKKTEASSPPPPPSPPTRSPAGAVPEEEEAAMSWLARSFANLTASDDGAGERRGAEASPRVTEVGEGGDGSEAGHPGRGVKEDISEITKTFTRQLWGVASFLAPPPAASPSRGSSPSPRAEEGDPLSSDPSVRSGGDPPRPTDSGEGEYSEVGLDTPRMAGIRSDFAEIGGRFRSGISLLSQNKAVEEISKMASTFLQFAADGDEEYAEEEDKELEEKYGKGGDGAIGVTEEVLTFARNISMHPETWLDFPLFPDDDAADDFDMSDAQQEHALAVEHLVPRLAALRIELCPSHMSEGCFWRIYFVLLHPRLNKQDAELLSTPQIVEARALLLQDLQNRTKSVADRSLSGGLVATSSGSYENMPYRKSSSEEDNPESYSETEKHPVVSTEIKIVDKSVIEEDVPIQTKDIQSDASKITIEKYEDNADDWLEEENIEIGGSTMTSVPIGNDEDVSFSDLEEDDEEKVPVVSKPLADALGSQATGSKGWVQLSKGPGGAAKDGTSTSPETKESNEWSDLDDIDVM
ncbi:hypothetical protein Taro_005478 [Colocasia esculenta]|uniref:BSD domain-containing protein n=1 Tax=Colocasia esculenta TaxID=4460 RepID=A0A843TSG4_COLES|nr:hypothetical protein [Colocasia esculenta]